MSPLILLKSSINFRIRDEYILHYQIYEHFESNQFQNDIGNLNYWIIYLSISQANSSNKS